MISEHPQSTCLNCGATLDHATSVGGEHAPRSGDFTICIKCQAVMVFADDLSLRGFTDKELEQLKADPEMNHFLTRCVRAMRFLRSQRN